MRAPVTDYDEAILLRDAGMLWFLTPDVMASADDSTIRYWIERGLREREPVYFVTLEQ